MTKTTFIFLTLFLLIGCASAAPASFPSAAFTRPYEGDVARFARWLISQGSWGFLTTLDSEGMPFSNVASYSDADSGTPYFYLSTLDPTAPNAKRNPASCLTLSEISFGGCSGVDPQFPTCAQINLTGLLLELAVNSSEAVAAEAALFADHPQFAGFPKQNGTFSVYKLKVEEITLDNAAATDADVNVEEYFKVIM